MKNFIYSWVISLFLIIAIDFAWLSVMFPRFYKPHLIQIFTADFNYAIAATFYILYSFGVSYLVILPSLHAGSSIPAVLFSGFVLGLITYGAYDLTNQATIKDWPYIVTVVDMMWGAVLTSIVSACTFKILSVILK